MQCVSLSYPYLTPKVTFQYCYIKAVRTMHHVRITIHLTNTLRTLNHILVIALTHFGV